MQLEGYLCFRAFFLVLNQGVVIEDGDWERGETEPRAKLGWTFRF